MPGSVRGSAFRQIQALYGAGSVAGLGDGPLLERFATLPGEAAEIAFAALVARHGPMVWRVCRRVLHDEHDAQDAFQATWLVLVRKAGSLRDQGSVGNWLFGVASRVALDIRATSSRRRLHEGQYAEGRPIMAPAEDRDGDELGGLLHEELRCLPERYRTPIVRCYLEGLTHEQAARQLGRPVGTVRSRLARGRERLRIRLSRRGIVLPAAGLIAILGQDASAAVPAPLVHATIQGATSLALIQSTTTAALFSARAILLSRGVLHAMLWNQLKTVGAAMVVLAALATTGAGLAADRSGARQGNAPTTSKLTARADRNQVVPGRSFAVYNLVPGQSTILLVLPTNAKVKKGQLVCELDSAALLDPLTKQYIATEGAKAAYQNAKLTRQVAEIAVTEYVEGLYKQEIQTAQIEIGLALAELKRAADRLEWSNKMLRKGFVSGAQNEADKLAFQRKGLSLKQSQTKMSVLERFTKEKTIKELQSDVEKARSDELAKQQTWKIEKARLESLQADLAHCKLVAPSDGELILAPEIEEGAMIHERQLLFRVLTETPAELPR